MSQQDDCLFSASTSTDKPTSKKTSPVRSALSSTLNQVLKLDKSYEDTWAIKLKTEPNLTRALVSFQANKNKPVYRWYKFKEAFSAELIEHVFNKYLINKGVVLDPFAGSGTALFVANSLGLSAEGIEILPIGQAIIKTKRIIELEFQNIDLERLIFWRDAQPWRQASASAQINEVRITRGAYPSETNADMALFLTATEEENVRVREVLFFALLCALESVSYTRKDGQFLRWDYRSGRRQGKKIFNKGEILPFDKAIIKTLRIIINDLRTNGAPQDLFATINEKPQLTLYPGSCLKILPQLRSNFYDCIITSPPYCNRYDYTRTYALELALMGIDEQKLLDLRQELLSCTVENRAKNLLALNPFWRQAIDIADGQLLLQSILSYLESQKQLGFLNNSGIPRMVRGYFYEMACVIQECARILKPGAPLIMVNDNVRYAGANISVDIILSEFAERLGLIVEQILVLPNGKGNSSQQMSEHGRETLRKCIYLWRKA